MTLTTTIILLGATLAVTAVANLMSRRPREFGRVHLFPYLGLQFIALAFALFLAAHLLSLLTGR